MLKIYRAPDGTTWQYDEGTQPEKYVLVEPKAEQPELKAEQPKAKARVPRNKARTTKAK